MTDDDDKPAPKPGDKRARSPSTSGAILPPAARVVSPLASASSSAASAPTARAKRPSAAPPAAVRAKAPPPPPARVRSIPTPSKPSPAFSFATKPTATPAVPPRKVEPARKVEPKPESELELEPAAVGAATITALAERSAPDDSSIAKLDDLVATLPLERSESSREAAFAAVDEEEDEPIVPVPRGAGGRRRRPIVVIVGLGVLLVVGIVFAFGQLKKKSAPVKAPVIAKTEPTTPTKPIEPAGAQPVPEGEHAIGGTHTADRIGSDDTADTIDGKQGAHTAIDDKHAIEDQEAAEKKAAEKKAAEDKKAAEALEKKAAEDQKAADKKAAEDQKAADKKAAEDKQALAKKAAEDQKAADKKAAEDKQALAKKDDTKADDKKPFGGKKVVVEYDTQARTGSPVAGASADDQKAIAKARSEYASGNQRLFAGDTTGAIRSYRRALTTYPGYVAAYRGLGLAYAQKGENAKAVQSLRTYLSSAPGAKDAPLLKKRITMLQGH